MKKTQFFNFNKVFPNANNSEVSYDTVNNWIGTHSKLIATFMPLMVYFIGYMKYYALLQKLDIKMPVNDIFPVTSIFVSGVSMLISLTYILFFTLAIVLWIKHTEQNNALGCPSNLVGYLLVLVSGIIPLFIRDFLLTPFRLSVLLFVAIFIGMSWILHTSKKYGWNIVLAIFLCWSICIGISYYSSLPSWRDSYFSLNADSRINQDSSISGYLVTNHILSPDSRHTDFYSQTETFYQTYGLLLSSHDGNYYFYTNRRLYLIPYNEVYLFSSFTHLYISEE